MKKNLFLAAVCGLLWAGCTTDAELGKGGFECKEGDVIRTELYFGLSTPGGGVVSESQWEEFVDGYITAKFKKGLTVIDANGQWLGETGEVIKEGTKIVILVHSDREEAIGYIREKYKELFEQESVLRVSDCVDADF